MKNAIITILIIMVVCLANALYQQGYFTNDCINLNNIKNYTIDNNNNSLHLVVKLDNKYHEYIVALD